MLCLLDKLCLIIVHCPSLSLVTFFGLKYFLWYEYGYIFFLLLATDSLENCLLSLYFESMFVLWTEVSLFIYESVQLLCLLIGEFYSFTKCKWLLINEDLILPFYLLLSVLYLSVSFSWCFCLPFWFGGFLWGVFPNLLFQNVSLV